MKYPSALQYIESLSYPSDFLKTLKGVTLAHNIQGEPIFSSGNFGVVFKVLIDDRAKALKCFTRMQNGRSISYNLISNTLEELGNKYIANFKYLYNEITSFDDDNNATEYSVLLMDWVEGETLTTKMRIAIATEDIKILSTLSVEFDKLASWILGQPFAHGDIKPDNIIVQPDMSMKLIDYDGIYTPEMRGQNQREIGTANFQHPQRAKIHFGKEIDHYSIAIISITLKILTLYPQFLKEYGLGSGAILSPSQIIQDKDNCYNFILKTELSNDILFQLLKSKTPILPDIEYIFGVKKVKKPNDIDVNNRESGFVVFRESGSYGFINANSDIIIAPKYNQVLEFSENMSAVKINNHWGYIDIKGSLRVASIYDSAGAMRHNMAAVSLGGRFGYINSKGKNVVSLKYDNAWSFREQRGLIKKSNKYGFVDNNGKIVIAIKFEFANSFSEGFACAKMNGKYGFIDANGKWVVRPKYDYAHSVKGGKALVEKDEIQRYITVQNRVK